MNRWESDTPDVRMPKALDPRQMEFSGGRHPHIWSQTLSDKCFTSPRVCQVVPSKMGEAGSCTSKLPSRLSQTRCLADFFPLLNTSYFCFTLESHHFLNPSLHGQREKKKERKKTKKEVQNGQAQWANERTNLQWTEKLQRKKKITAQNAPTTPYEKICWKLQLKLLPFRCTSASTWISEVCSVSWNVETRKTLLHALSQRKYGKLNSGNRLKDIQSSQSKTATATLQPRTLSLYKSLQFVHICISMKSLHCYDTSSHSYICSPCAGKFEPTNCM